MRSLAHPAFRRLLLADTLSVFGSLMTFIVLPLVVWDQTGSANAYAGTLVAGSIGMLVSMPLGGVLADRADRRRLLLIGDVVSIVLMVAFFAAVQTHTWYALPVISLVQTGCGSLFASAGPALRRELLPDELRQQGSAVFQGSMQLAQVMGPLVGAAIYAAAGYRTVIAVDTATYALSFVLLLGLRFTPCRDPDADVERDVDRVNPVRRAARDLRDGLRAARSDTFVSRQLLWAGSLGLGNGIILVLMVPWLRSGLGLPPSAFGVMIATMGAAGVTGSLVVARLAGRVAPRTLLIVALGLEGASAVGYLGTPSFARVLAASLAMGFANVGLFVGVDTTLQRRVPTGFQGRLASLRMCSVQGMQLVGAVLCAVVLAHLRPTTVMSGFAIATSVSLLLGARAIAALRHPAPLVAADSTAVTDVELVLNA